LFRKTLTIYLLNNYFSSEKQKTSKLSNDGARVDIISGIIGKISP
jgi:hypothetical protein